MRSATGTMAPFSSFAPRHWTMGPASLTRYNGLPAIEIQGGAAGHQHRHRDGRDGQTVPATAQGVGFEPTGLSYQEERARRAGARRSMGLSILIIYLCLAALYESWAIPLSVMLVIPLGVVGAVWRRPAARHLFNDIYFQVGLAHHHRPVRQERHPDRGIRGGR